MLLLTKIFDILNNYSNKDNLINKVRISPDNKRIVVDANFNKAITIRQENNKLIIEGDTDYCNRIKDIIEEAIR